MRLQTRETNNKYADLFGINRSAAITTIKPSGTVSQLVDSASGVHRQFAPRYIRRIRGDMNDPTTKLLIDAGVPWEPDSAFGNTAVYLFVKRAPNQDRRTFRDNESAVEFMEYVKMFGDYWTDHNPSVTVNVKDHEWLDVGAWVYKNLDSVCGMSFLPYDGGSYVQAPYEETDEAELAKIEAAMPKSIDWSRLPSFGDGDEFVTATKELACVAGVCEVTSFGNSAA
jgi:ribonucleoside-diphosphate reductase alpha chain